jgi:predicted amidohydrolase
MRILLTAVNCAKGEIERNLGTHLELLRQGAAQRCDLVLLPEMSLTGYQPAAAITLEHPAVAELAAATSGGPAACFGLVEQAGDGGAPYIAQVVAAAGAAQVVHRKNHLGEGEPGMFRPGRRAGTFTIAGTTCTLAVCAEIGARAAYQAGSALVLGPAAPGLYGQRRASADEWQRGFDWWHGNVLGDARRLLAPGQLLAVSSQQGATDDEDFPGWACLVGSGGEVLAELPDWREGTLCVEVPAGQQGSAISVHNGFAAG